MRAITTLLIAAVFAAALASNAMARDWWKDSDTSTPVDVRAVSKDKTSEAPQTAVRVNWVDQYVEVVAWGTADRREAINMAHGLTLAYKTARHLAYEKLAESIHGIKIDSDSTYDRELMQDANLRLKLSTLIQGAKVVEESHSTLEDGSTLAKVTLGIHLYGPQSLMSNSAETILERTAAEAAPERTGKTTAAMASGLIIDATGLELSPAMAPKVYDTNGRLVYGGGNVSRDFAVRYGLASYAPSLDAARKHERAGASPRVIKAIKSTGDGNCNLVINAADANMLLRSAGMDTVFKESRVVIAVD